jgi:hypothetical protein
MGDWGARRLEETLRPARPARPSNEKRRSVLKIKPLPGTLRAELVRCGKPSCRCANGQRHGPYLYHRWRERGRQRRRYVRPADAEHVRACLAEWRRLHPPARSMREVLRVTRRETRELFCLLDLLGF